MRVSRWRSIRWARRLGMHWRSCANASRFVGTYSHINDKAIALMGLSPSRNSKRRTQSATINIWKLLLYRDDKWDGTFDIE